MKDLQVVIGGKTSQLGIRWLQITQKINEIPTARLELTILQKDNGKDDSRALSEASSYVTGATLVVKSGTNTVFSGELTQKKVRLQGKKWSVRLEAKHALYHLAFIPHSKIFRQQDDTAILTTLCQQADVRLNRSNISTQLNTRHEQLVQFRVSDWQFIRSRLLSTNCWLIPDITGSSVTVAPLDGPQKAALTIKGDSTSNEVGLTELNLNFDNRFIPDSMSLQGWDITAQQLSAAQQIRSGNFQPWKSSSADIKPITSKWDREYKLAFSSMPETTLTTLSRSWLNYFQLTGVQGTILLEGTQAVHPGESVTLSDFDASLDGSVIVTGVNQMIDVENGWQTELVIGQPGTLPEPIPVIDSLHIATVADFSADPQQLERIPISLPALNLPHETLFARLAKPWASKSSGFCFYPDPGDEVVVGFIENDPRFPIILGALHNPKNRSPFPPEKSNASKGLVMKNEDQSGALLFNSQSHTLSFSIDKSILQMNADGKIELSGETEIEIISNSIKMSN